MSYCQTCGNEFADDAAEYCPHDGTPLIRGRKPEPPRVQSVMHGGAQALAELRNQVAGNPHDRLVGAVLDDRYLIQHKVGEGGMV